METSQDFQHTISSNGYNPAELLRCVSVEEDLSDKSIQGYQNCCVVFDDILDSNQKLIDQFFSLEEDKMI